MMPSRTSVPPRRRLRGERHSLHRAHRSIRLPVCLPSTSRTPTANSWDQLMVKLIGLKRIATPPIVAEIVVTPAAAGAVYVAVQTPVSALQVAALIVPPPPAPVAASVKSAGVTFNTGFPN